MTFLQVVLLLLVFIPLVMLWGFALVDLFKREEINGGAKALWAIAIVFLPILGMFVYFATRPSLDQEASTVLEGLERLSELHDQGKLSDEEFEAQKAILLGQG